MKPYFLGTDGKPCIWPVPVECVWTLDRYKLKSCLRVFADDEFKKEASSFTESLKESYQVILEEDITIADVSVLKCHDSNLEPEGYYLEAGESGVEIKALSDAGAFYGLQTLYQLIINSPDPSIHGVKIADNPFKAFRGVCTSLPGPGETARFKRFVDIIARYKFNKLVFKTGMNPESLYEVIESTELSNIEVYIRDRHIDIIKEPEASSCSYFTELPYREYDNSDNRKFLINTGNFDLYKLLKASCMLWWSGYKAERTTAGLIMPEYLERIVVQLYPFERAYLNTAKYSSQDLKGCKALDIREFYNAPLYRRTWKVDDYDYMYLEDAKNIPNTARFSILQGVKDMGRENAFILAGNGWNNDITGIPVNLKASSLIFLHSYTTDLKTAENNMDKAKVSINIGSYLVHYSDGSSEEVEIEFGRNISYWKADRTGNCGAPEADPAILGVTSYGVPYILYSSKWINPKPELTIKRLDIMHDSTRASGGIAVFGITAVVVAGEEH